MDSQALETFFEHVLFRHTGKNETLKNYTFVSGGCINTAAKISTSNDDFFIKWNELTDGLFEEEANGLEILAATDSFQIPEVYGNGKHEDKNYLLMSFVETGRDSPRFWNNFGQRLAQLHVHSASDFGLDHNNHIGSLPQRNSWTTNWVDFYIQERLEVQIGLAIYNGNIENKTVSRIRDIYPILKNEMPEEKSALVHGDLWSGNFLVAPSGQACLIDPSVHYGHREVELAFTRLFGGFDPAFYHAYQDAFPLEPDFEKRMPLYHLYPLLVHLNLFGASYLHGIENILRKYGC